jgi:hypothetical protein
VWDIPEYLQREIDVRRTEEVTFTQLRASPFRYRDAIRFRNGREILLQRLQEGQRVRVLSLSVADFADLAMQLNDRVGPRQSPVPLPAAARADVHGINNLFTGGARRVEALFAELKNQIGLRRLRLRRMKFVREQFFLAATGGDCHACARQQD